MKNTDKTWVSLSSASQIVIDRLARRRRSARKLKPALKRNSDVQEFFPAAFPDAAEKKAPGACDGLKVRACRRRAGRELPSREEKCDGGDS
jgi:hypothetical protein